MIENLKYKCVKCSGNNFFKSSTFWRCDSCNTLFPTFQGMPKLYLESNVGQKDKSVRAHFYNGTLGMFYQYLMPFLHLPVRPLKITKKDWFAYFLTVFVIIFLIYNTISLALHYNDGLPVWDLMIKFISVFLLFFIIIFFAVNPPFFYLFLVAVPVKISLNIKRYKPKESFTEVHKKNLERFLAAGDRKLQMLDISTGTGNSLHRHGWMKLNAEYTGLDLSQVMLAQCQSLLRDKDVTVDLIIGDAGSLPFADNYFDIVTNYGAVNGYTDIKKALAEMARVIKKDGLVLFLDEQMYPGNSWIEKIYFNRVLSSHCTIRHCPVELLPDGVININVYQVYEFYYICTFNKAF